LSLSNESNVEEVINKVKTVLRTTSILERTQGTTLLILDNIDSFFSANEKVFKGLSVHAKDFRSVYEARRTPEGTWD
jgi:late competence protein required for DNA uptake (superfamily II DNA/RNA helicase)